MTTLSKSKTITDMKNLTLLIAAMAVAVSASALTPVKGPDKVRRQLHAKKEQPTSRVRAARVAENAALKWQPSKVSVAAYENSKWVTTDNYTYTYNSAAKPVTEYNESLEDGSVAYTAMKYNSDNLITEELQKSAASTTAELVNSQLITYQYDPVMKSVITEHIDMSWENDSWVNRGNSYKRKITRNEAGNVTQVQVQVYFQDIYDPTQQIDITYGADGKATTIVMQELQYNGTDYYWKETTRYEDIVWENTDGQFSQAEDFTVGTNRIKSAKQTSSSSYGNVTYNISVTYTGDQNYTYISATPEGDFSMTETYTVLDDFGSYRLVQNVEQEYYAGMTYTVLYDYTYKVDEWNNILLEEYTEDWGDGAPNYEAIKGTVTNDPDTGLPAEYLETYGFSYPDYNEYQDDEPVYKVTFADYVDVTGIREVETAGADAPAEYYNLQGIRLNCAPATGLYLERRGGKVTKKLAI